MSLVVIHRVQLSLAAHQSVTLPGFIPGRALHVERARDGSQQIEIWYLAGENILDQRADVAVHMVGTGQPFELHGDHIGTVLIGPFVWHVFVEYPVGPPR